MNGEPKSLIPIHVLGHSAKVSLSQLKVITITCYIVIFYDLCVFFDFNNLGNLFAINVTVLVAVVGFNGFDRLCRRRL